MPVNPIQCPDDFILYIEFSEMYYTILYIFVDNLTHRVRSGALSQQPRFSPFPPETEKKRKHAEGTAVLDKASEIPILS